MKQHQEEEDKSPDHQAAKSSLQVPGPLQEPLEQLLDLVIRDFVTSWYDSYISLGDSKFPAECRRALDVVTTALVGRIQRLHRKEVAIYLLSSLSGAIVRQMQGLNRDETPDVLKAKLRKAAEELLHTTAPPSALTAPANTALLSEILVLQLWKVVESVDSDFINTTIVSYLGEDQPTLRQQVAEKAQDLVELQQHLNQPEPDTALNTELPSVEARAEFTPLPATTPDLAPLPDIAALKRCLAGPPELVESLLVQADQYFQHHPEPLGASLRDELLTSILDGSNEVLADSFGEYIQKLEPALKARGRMLERLYGRTTSLHQMLASGAIPPDRMRQDAMEGLLQFIDTLREDWADRTLTTTLHACLARMHRRQATAFEPLQRWIEMQLDASHFRPFVKLAEANEGFDLTSSAASTADTSSPRPSFDVDASTPTVPSTSTTKGAAGMSLPNESVDSVSSANVDFSAIGVTLTDISEPEAYDASTQRVKAKRHLAFLVALEPSTGAPGYVLMRSFTEIERMDLTLTKLFPTAGSSAAFPRALLPSPNHKTSDMLCRELEGYLRHLLSNNYYGPSEPVQDFFQKERSGPAQPGMSLWDLGKNAQRASKSIAKSGDAVLTGVGTVLNGFKPPAEVPRFMRLGSAVDAALPPVQSQPVPSSSASSSPRASTSVDTSPRVSEDKPKSNLGPHRAPTAGAAGAAAAESNPKASLNERRPSSSSAAGTASSASSRQAQPLKMSASADGRPRAPVKGEVASSHTQQQQQHKRSSSQHHRDRRPVFLTAADLDHIISSALTVLEEAYLLSNSQWSFKRGLLKVIETVVRTSYLGLLGAAFLEALHTLNVEEFAERIQGCVVRFYGLTDW